MAYTNNQFKGYIDGKAIWNYGRKFDYENTNLDYRLDKVKEGLNLNENGTSDDRFWQDVWDTGVCKSGLNITDDLWSDTNVCKSLCTHADYLLEAYKHQDNKEKIKVYTDKELFKRALEEEEFLLGMSDANNDHLKVFVDANKNYKLSKDIEVEDCDIERYKEIKSYDELKEYMLKLHKDAKKRNRLARKKNLPNRKLYTILNRNRKLLEEDKLDFKISKERPIIWKSPLKDSGNEIDWECLDMFDIYHVKALLQVKHDVDLSYDVYIDRDELIKKIELTDIQKSILELWRMDVTQEVIAKELNVSRANVNKHLDRIANKIIDAYEKEYEEKHYYLNIVKGKYKKCSKCDKVKILQRFDKNGKKGYRSNCKDCN